MGNSIECIGSAKAIYQPDGVERWKKDYQCFKVDFGNLPRDDSLASGSTAMILDTGEYAEYHRPSRIWKIICAMNGNGAGGSGGAGGLNGKSAYELALDHGFAGTEEEWLESLKGSPKELLSDEISDESTWSSAKISEELKKLSKGTVTYHETDNDFGGKTVTIS